MELWCASFDVASTTLTASDLAEAFGEVGALFGEIGGRSRAGKTFSENTWRVATSPSPTSAERHLSALFDAAAAPARRFGTDDVDGAVLTVSHYGVDPAELTSRLFIAPEWVGLLDRLHGWIEVEHRVTQPTGLPKFVTHPVGLLATFPE